MTPDALRLSDPPVIIKLLTPDETKAEEQLGSAFYCLVCHTVQFALTHRVVLCFFTQRKSKVLNTPSK